MSEGGYWLGFNEAITPEWKCGEDYLMPDRVLVAVFVFGVFHYVRIRKSSLLRWEFEDWQQMQKQMLMKAGEMVAVRMMERTYEKAEE